MFHVHGVLGPENYYNIQINAYVAIIITSNEVENAYILYFFE